MCGRWGWECGSRSGCAVGWECGWELAVASHVRHGSARQVAGLSFSATSSEGRVKQFESQLVIELKLTTIALSMASVCARPLQTGSSVAVCASRLMPLGDCELGGERLGLAGELELGLVGVGE